MWSFTVHANGPVRWVENVGHFCNWHCQQIVSQRTDLTIGNVTEYQISGQDCNGTLETWPNAVYSLLTTDATATIAAPETTVRWWTISDVHQAA